MNLNTNGLNRFNDTHSKWTWILIVVLIFSDSQLTRKAPSSYSDGVYKMSGDSRPSARTLSQIFMKGKDGMGSLRNRTGIATFFGKIDKTHIKTLCVQYLLEIS
jgi:hypothetical protein